MLGRLRIVVLACAMSSALSMACGRYQPMHVYQVDRRADPALASEAVQQTLEAGGYRASEQPLPARATRVVAHTGKGSASESWITILVAENGRIELTPGGGLVKGNTVHRRLAREVEVLRQQINVRISVLARSKAAPPRIIPATHPAPPQRTGTPVVLGPSPSAPRPPQKPSPSLPPLIPRAWNERASDGAGEFTCVPARVSAEQLKLGLSDGSEADLTYKVKYAPGVCRSASACTLPDGCPALGLGDSSQVERLARRLNDGEISSDAVLLRDELPVAIVDLLRHGTIQQALTALGASSQSVRNAKPRAAPAPH